MYKMKIDQIFLTLIFFFSAWRAEFGQNFRKLWRFGAGIWATVSWFLWRLGEIHIHKVVAFIIIMVAVYEVRFFG